MLKAILSSFTGQPSVREIDPCENLTALLRSGREYFQRCGFNVSFRAGTGRDSATALKGAATERTNGSAEPTLSAFAQEVIRRDRPCWRVTLSRPSRPGEQFTVLVFAGGLRAGKMKLLIGRTGNFSAPTLKTESFRLLLNEIWVDEKLTRRTLLAGLLGATRGTPDEIQPLAYWPVEQHDPYFDVHGPCLLRFFLRNQPVPNNSVSS